MKEQSKLSTSVPRSAAVEVGGRPLVSVVTASFNALDLLRDTVENVAAQGGQQQHIIVDGGSTDGTAEYLTRLERDVRWISEPDRGIADAMNKAIELARGHWILVLHAGDGFAASDSLEEAVKHITPDIDILLCGIRHGGQAATRDRHFRFARQRLLFKAIWHQGALVRRDVFDQLGGFDTSYRVAMDYDFFLRARNSNLRFKSVPLVLARMDDGGLSSRRDWASLHARFEEERRTQMSHCPNALMRAVYTAYWPTYLAYRRLRSLLSSS